MCASKMFIARNQSAYSVSIHDNTPELSDEIIIPSYHINILMSRFADGEPLLLNMTNTENDLKYIVSFGQGHNFDKNTIFVPDWILEQIGHNGLSDVAIRLNKIDSDQLPTATKITIKPLDPIAFELDISSCFEKVMINLHTVKEGVTIPVYVPEIGKDFVMFAYIEKVEPDTTSRIVDGEVEVDFINDFVSSSPTMPIHDTEESVPVEQVLSEQLSAPSTSMPHPLDEISPEERRNQVRNSWLKRFQNTSESQ